MRRPWPEEVNEYIRENVAGHSAAELAEMLNASGIDPDTTYTKEMIKGAKSRLGVKSGTPGGWPKGYSPKYPEGMLDFVRSIAEGKSTAELVDAVNEKYGPDTITIRHMKAYKKNHNINTGLTGRFEPGHVPQNKGKKMPPEVYAKAQATMFKKGQRPPNHMEVGEYSHTSDGYLIRKVQETGTQRERWEFVHRATWEKHNGPIPEGMLVEFKDGNKDNCSIDNLVLVDRAVHLELTRSDLRSTEAEVTEAGVALATLKVAAGRRKRELKSHDE